MIMKYLTLTLFSTFFIWIGVASTTFGQSNARERQAAAEAYDRGTAAYLAQDYAKAAQWFETANRMAPAAAALIQAIRAHSHANNALRAATLALQLQKKHGSDPVAAQFSSEVLSKNENNYVKIKVNCQQCTIDLNGTLQEYDEFFVEPNTSHSVVAHFDSGDDEEEVYGTSGDTKTLDFEAPPPGANNGLLGGTVTGNTLVSPSPTDDLDSSDKKPLSPAIMWIGVGVTGAAGIATIIAAVDMYGGKSDYEEKAAKYVAAQEELEIKQNSTPLDITQEELNNVANLEKTAKDALEKGETKQLVTTVLGISTGVLALGTAIIGIFFTDWSDDEENETKLSTHIAPSLEGGYVSIKARF